MGIQPWKQFTPTALCRTQVQGAGKPKPPPNQTPGKHPETSRTAISSSCLGSAHRALFLALYLPGTETHLAGGWGERGRTRVVPFAVLTVLFSAAQSPSVAETLHPAFTGVQQYAGTSFPCLPQAPVWLSRSSGKRFVLSPRNPAVYPTTTITPIAQSIPQPPPILQQQQREGEDRGGHACPAGGGAGVCAARLHHKPQRQR